VANVIGQRILRKEDPRFLRGEGQYVENLPLENALHVTFVRSPLAHARITGIDATAASELPGVQVLTAADVEIEAMPAPPYIGELGEFMARRFIAKDVVRFAGEIVAIVLSETRAAGVDAAELVVVDYDPLPAVTNPRDAVTGDVLLYPDAGSNVCMRIAPEEPDENFFADCEVVVSGSLTSQRMAPSPLEPRSSAATFEDGRLSAWLSTQTPHQDHAAIAGLLELDPEQVRVVAPDVGGGFGAKMLGIEEVLITWLAKKLGRPVRWTETRSENMVAMGHGRGQVLDFEIGGSRDGTISAYRLKVLQDAGAYPGIGTVLPTLTSLMSSGVYAIPKIEVDCTSVVTNATTVGAFRGAGRPEASQAIERAVDAFAAEIDMDPAEVRRKNFIPNDAFPYTTASGAMYDIGDYGGALDRALDAIGYDELRAEQQRRRDAGEARLLGIGLAVYVEVTNGLVEPEYARVEITPEGEAIVYTGSFSHGQGHETTFAMIVAEQLGLPVESVTVRKGDTATVPRGTGTYGSKSTQIGGVAASQAAEQVVDRAKKLAADLLETSADDVVLDVTEGRLHVAGAPQVSLSWSELAERAQGEGRLEELDVEHDFTAASPTFPFGAHAAVVEVDAETGGVELVKMVAVDDAGTIISPLVAEGQAQGGVGSGIAQALYEEVVYDDAGNPLTASFATYEFPSAADMPLFERVAMETPTPVNPLGAKGIGESGTIGATPAVHNAVIDAVSHLGVKHVEMPANGERVWRALAEAQA
jgi:carbon-monoxide dehydrogenase large subunit